MLRTNYSLLGEVIAARRNYTFEQLMQIAYNNMKHAKVKTVKTEQDKTSGKIETISYPPTKLQSINPL